VEPIAEADRGIVRRLLELEPWPEPRPPAAPIRLASRDEVDAHWHGAPATDALYRGMLELADELTPFALGEERGIVVRVTNRSSHVWPQGGVGWPAVRIAYRWLDENDEQVVSDGLRTPLPATLPPDASLLAPVDVLAPPVAGAHTLVLDLLHEHVRWFGCELRLHVDVRPALCIALIGQDEEAATAAAATLAEVAPAVRPVVLAASPEVTRERHGYRAAPDARTYVLGGDTGRSRLRAMVGALARTSALLGDATLARLGARPRLAAPAGVAFLDALREADALVIVGDAALRGARGERESLQQRAAILAARTLGLETTVVPADDGLPFALSEVVRALRVRPS
jgi:hypothetical protein